ncbi:MAG: TIGR04086 family membrane protein [Oscillospiraceae bacterium]|nr:TIGR04086 family membrane protein [Oscillospiraceae bacterium]MBQ8780649.1 TIGR04086 family membrane protein [Oscillospiraceae bacterium]
MRKTPEERLRKERITAIVYSILACVGAVFITALIFSSIATIIDFDDGAFTLMSSAALCAGCFGASFTAAKRRKKDGLKTGLLCGIIIFGVTLLLGLIFVRSFSVGGFFTKILIILICSSLGGIIGVNSPRRFR